MARLVFPRQTRQWLRRAYDGLRFDAAMKRFIANPPEALATNSRVLNELISSWGNSGWIAQEGFLRACLANALVSSGPTLECGSGLSTLLLGVVAQQRGYEHWALEHMPEWGMRVNRGLVRHRVRAVRLCTAPLKNYGGYAWYDPPLARLPRTFALVVCDGPPADTKGGRYGLVPILRDRLAPGCVILLDDAQRDDERTIARRWTLELGATVQIIDDYKPFIRLVVPKHEMAEAVALKTV
ncbi:MAG TPA: class I SAM-dependent methyltransferase [Burkholderiaceae bacterium]|nr:class I SAM-dependent methyltransferase [Burkholderiaceae bacterium]